MGDRSDRAYVCRPCTVTVGKQAQSLGSEAFFLKKKNDNSWCSLLPCCRCCQNNAVSLNGSRNAFTNIANLLLYGVAFASFGIYEGKSKSATGKQFFLISVVVVVLGSAFCIAYLILVPEPKKVPASELDQDFEHEVKWTKWLKV